MGRYPKYLSQSEIDRRKEETRKKYSGDRSLSKFDQAFFVAWDGEGINACGLDEGCQVDRRDDGVECRYHNCHKYVLLQSSVQEIAPLVEIEGISTRNCLDYIMRVASGVPSYAIHVGYGFGYDVNFILKDLSYEDCKMLHQGMTVPIDGGVYEVTYHQRKMFRITKFAEDVKKRWVTDPKTKKTKKVHELSITIWDVHGFYQSSFVRALKSYMGDDYYLLDKIIEGKKQRGSFTKEGLESFVIPYNTAELVALVDLMKMLHQHLKDADIVINQWYGAGAISAFFLDKFKVKDHMSRDTKNGVSEQFPDEVMTAIQYAMAGGRIENMMYGNYVGPVHQNDINSAYPAVMPTLPSLRDGRWVLDKKPNIEAIPSQPFYYLHLVEWQFPEMPFYPFFYRKRSGAILFPRIGKNWVSGAEVQAALRSIPDCAEYIKVMKTWKFYPATDEKPFAFIRDLYQHRRKLKDEKNGAEKVFKLGYNGMFGKLAQKAGYYDGPDVVESSEDEKKKYRHQGSREALPTYHQLYWAGLITGCTRAKMFEAAMQKPDSIISFATDGVFSTEALDLPVSRELGDWEYKVHEGITLVQSGVYWWHDTEDGKKVYKPYYRGFDEGSINRELVLEEWKNKHTKNNGFFEKDKEPHINAMATRFMTIGCLVSTETRFDKLHNCWYSLPRKLDLTMSGVVKRDDVKRRYGPKNGPHATLVKTIAAEDEMVMSSAKIPMSHRHILPWLSDEEGTERIDGLVPTQFIAEWAASES